MGAVRSTNEHSGSIARYSNIVSVTYVEREELMSSIHSYAK